MKASERIASRIVARLDGDRIEEEFDRYRELVRRGIGGFILFGGDVESLRSGLTELRREAGRKLLIASDLEQGLGQQVSGGTVFPSAEALGTAALLPDGALDPVLVGDVARTVAREALSVGINIVLAPVADVATNPRNPVIGYRAFGPDPERVGACVEEYIRGIQTAGPGEGTTPFACAKHFPGHGDTDLDSHLSLPEVDFDRNRLDRVELAPFRRAIAAGVRTVMMAHLLVKALDGERPASLSRRVVGDLLRKELGFDGLVMTDALNMGGITSVVDETEAAVRALEAGCDILLHPSDPAGLIESLEREWERVAPFLDEGRFQRALDTLPDPLDNKDTLSLPLPSAEGRSLAQTVARRALQLVRGEPELEGDELVLLLDDDGEEDTGDPFINEICRWYGCLDLRKLGPGRFHEPDDMAEKPVVLLIFSRIRGWKGRGGLSPELDTFIETIVDKGNVILAVVFGPPVIGQRLGRVPALVYAFGTDEAVQRAGAELLSGEIPGRASANG